MRDRLDIHSSQSHLAHGDPRPERLPHMGGSCTAILQPKPADREEGSVKADSDSGPSPSSSTKNRAKWGTRCATRWVQRHPGTEARVRVGLCCGADGCGQEGKCLVSSVPWGSCHGCTCSTSRGQASRRKGTLLTNVCQADTLPEPRQDPDTTDRGALLPLATGKPMARLRLAQPSTRLSLQPGGVSRATRSCQYSLRLRSWRMPREALSTSNPSGSGRMASTSD